MTGYDSWLEAPRASADRAAEWDEAIDEYLGAEYDEACKLSNGHEPAAGCQHMDATDALDYIMQRDDAYLLLRHIILCACSSHARDTVDGAVHRMIEAGRQAYIADQANRKRAIEDMEGSNHD